MPARDRYHDVVVRALEKDGWQIVGEQFAVQVDRRFVVIDIAARHLNQSLVIMVEVKTFETAPSLTHAFSRAMGQYLMYRVFLQSAGITHDLYLAVTDDDYRRIMQDHGLREVSLAYNIFWIVCDIEEEKLVQWIPSPGSS